MSNQNQSDKHHIKDNILTLLPGKNTRHTLKTEMLRVDHAGEFGAVHIYRGQIDVLKHSRKKSQTVSQFQHMQAQEIVHLAKFNAVLPQRRIRPSALSPLWKLGGYAMGAVTAFISPKSAMACTEAVETVIDQHYDKQIDFFSKEPDIDPLLQDLKQFQQDELDHKQEAIENNSQEAPFYKATTGLIKIVCHGVIKLAHKV